MADQAELETLRGRKCGRKKVSPQGERLLAEIKRLREVIAEISTENLELIKVASASSWATLHSRGEGPHSESR